MLFSCASVRDRLTFVFARYETTTLDRSSDIRKTRSVRFDSGNDEGTPVKQVPSERDGREEGVTYDDVALVVERSNELLDNLRTMIGLRSRGLGAAVWQDAKDVLGSGVHNEIELHKGDREHEYQACVKHVQDLDAKASGLLGDEHAVLCPALHV